MSPGAKTIKKNTNSTQNKSETHRTKQYEVTSFLSTDCELSTETCSKNVYSLGPWLRVSARPLITDVTTHRAPSLDGFQHFRFYCSNFAVKYLLIIADILVITYTGELMFNIMICNITKIRIRLSIYTSSEVVLSSICSLNILVVSFLISYPVKYNH